MMAIPSVTFPDVLQTNTPYAGHLELLGGKSYVVRVDIFEELLLLKNFLTTAIGKGKSCYI